MFLYSNDPIVSLMKNYYEDLKDRKNCSYESLEQTFQILILEKKLIKASAYAHKMMDIDKGNVRAILNYADVLFNIGLYFDAEKFIYQKFDEYRHVLIFVRLFNLLDYQYEWGRLVEISLENIDLIRQHERTQHRFYEILNKIQRYDILSKFQEMEKTVLKDDDNFEIVDLYLSIANKNKNLCDKITWNLYRRGLRTKEFFRLTAQRYFDEANYSWRLNFFITEAFYYYPDDYDFLYQYCCYKNLLGYYEKAAYTFKRIDLNEILMDFSIDDNLREEFYYLYLKYSALMGYSKETFLTYSQASKYKLVHPFILDFMKSISLEYMENNHISEINQSILISLPSETQKIIQKLIEIILENKKAHKGSKLGLIFSGQLRGGRNSLHAMKEFTEAIQPDQVLINTWNKMPIVPPRINNLDRIFSPEIISKIPKDYANFGALSKKFPKFVKKIQASEFKILTDSDFNELNQFNLSIDIVNEDSFDSIYSKKNGFRIINRIHQAKMYYQFDKALSNSDKNCNVILRKRPDTYAEFKVDLVDYINLLQSTSNYMYVDYLGIDGSIGDQFALGDRLAMTNFHSLWEVSIYADKLVYADFFDQLSQHAAAEQLAIMHAIALGINIRYLACRNRKFISSDYFEMISLKNEILDDYNVLSNQDKIYFKKFYDHILEIVH